MSWQQPAAARRVRGGVQLNKAAVVSRLLQSNRPAAARRSYESSGSSSTDDDDEVEEEEEEDWRRSGGGSPSPSRSPELPPAQATATAAVPRPDLRELRLEAGAGSAAAQAALGTLLWADDQAQALAYLRLAANQGHAAASYRLGAATQAGGDLEAAAAHFEKAADGGHAEAQLRLGEMCEGGEGVPQDTARAMHYYRSAIAHGGGGHTEHAAANNLAELLVAEAVRGSSASPSPTSVASSPHWAEAQRHFESAAGAGFVDAQYNLGQMRLVEGDAEGAAVWLRLAAEQQHAEAARSLATLYRSGRLAPVDVDAPRGAEEEATRLYRIAAQGGLDAAQYALAWRLFRGEGTDRSLSESLSWFRSAAEQGHADAEKALRNEHELRALYLEQQPHHTKAAEPQQARPSSPLSPAQSTTSATSQGYSRGISSHNSRHGAASSSSSPKRQQRRRQQPQLAVPLVSPERSRPKRSSSNNSSRSLSSSYNGSRMDHTGSSGGLPRGMNARSPEGRPDAPLMYKLEVDMPVRSAASFAAAVVGHVSYGDFFEGHTQAQDHSGRRWVRGSMGWLPLSDAGQRVLVQIPPNLESFEADVRDQVEMDLRRQCVARYASAYARPTSVYIAMQLLTSPCWDARTQVPA